MDLHRTSSRAPVCDAERPPSGAFELPAASAAQFAHPDADVRIAARAREEKALDALEAQITRLWGNINAATAQFLALLTEFDRKEGWAQHGMASCAHWLSWQCGIGPVAAREKVRTARALESLPKIAEAFGEGRLSYSKVRALTRVATAATEATLLHIALRGTAEHVERTVRGFRRVQRENERNEAEAVHERRYLDYRRESDGSVRLEARLAPEVGEMLLKALEAAHAQLDGPGGDAERVGAAEPAADSVPADVSAETPVQPAGHGGWRRSMRRAAWPSTPTPPAAAGLASAWTTTSPSTRCAGRRAIPERPPELWMSHLWFQHSPGCSEPVQGLVRSVRFWYGLIYEYSYPPAQRSVYV